MWLSLADAEAYLTETHDTGFWIIVYLLLGTDEVIGETWIANCNGLILCDLMTLTRLWCTISCWARVNFAGTDIIITSKCHCSAFSAISLICLFIWRHVCRWTILLQWTLRVSGMLVRMMLAAVQRNNSLLYKVEFGYQLMYALWLSDSSIMANTLRVIFHKLSHCK